MSYAIAGLRSASARVATHAAAPPLAQRIMPAIADPTTMPECGSGNFCPATAPMAFRDDVNNVPTNLALWTEALHVGVRGDPSLMVFLEEFTRQNLAAWLSPEGMQSALYDLGKGAAVTIDQGLVARAAAALQNFNDIFQPDRWTVNPRGASQIGADENGPRTYYFETWEEGVRPRPVVMNDALARVFGHVVGGFERDPWLAQVSSVMRQVPRYTGPCCGDQTNILVGGPPTWTWAEQPMPAASHFFWRVSNGKLQPSTWMASMLDLLAPASTVTTGSPRARAPMSARTASAPRAGTAPPPATTGGGHTALIIGALLLVAGGGAAFWWSRRRK